MGTVVSPVNLKHPWRVDKKESTVCTMSSPNAIQCTILNFVRRENTLCSGGGMTQMKKIYRAGKHLHPPWVTHPKPP